MVAVILAVAGGVTYVVLQPSSNGERIDIEFTLETVTRTESPIYAYMGVGGEIDGELNPTLSVHTGESISITLVNRDAVKHDLAIDDLDVYVGAVGVEGASDTVVFTVDEPGEYRYYCVQPGHRSVGMEGFLVVDDQ